MCAQYAYRKDNAFSGDGLGSNTTRDATSCGANDHNFGYVFTSFDEDYFNASRTVAMAWSKTGLLI